MFTRLMICILLVYNCTLMGCGREPVEKRVETRVEVPVPGDPAPIPFDMAGLYVSDENASEVEIYTEANRAYVKKISLEFINTYSGVDYNGVIDLTSGFYTDIIAQAIEVKGPVFKAGTTTLTTEGAPEWLSNVSNYSSALGNHQAYILIVPTDSGIAITVKFNGSTRYRDGTTYFNRVVRLRKAQ